MKSLFLSLAVLLSMGCVGCEKNGQDSTDNLPVSDVPAGLRGTWMYGFFSLTEYWSQNPSEYLGNGFEMAIAFKFEANGTFTQYFTSSYVSGGVRTYMQSVSKGTVVVNEATHSFTTYTKSAHYKSTRNGQTVEERDLAKSELSGPTGYTYEYTTENNGAKSIQLKMQGTSSPLPFIQKL